MSIRRVAPSASALARDVVVLGMVWGASVVLQRIAVAEIEPLPLATLRCAAAFVAFLPFLPRIRRGLAKGARLLDVAIVGALNPALSGILSGLALQFASSGVVAVLISLAPIFTALLAKLLLDEPPLRRGQLGGLGLAFTGVAVLIATRTNGLGTSLDGDLRGHALALTIAVAMAVSTVYTRRRLVNTDPLAAAAGQIGAGLLLLLPATLLLAEPVVLADIGGLTWLTVIVSGAVGLSASFVLFLGMIERHGPTGALLALYVMPIAATILGALFLGETITAPMGGGTALVLAGVVLFTKR